MIPLAVCGLRFALFVRMLNLKERSRNILTDLLAKYLAKFQCMVLDVREVGRRSLYFLDVFQMKHLSNPAHSMIFIHTSTLSDNGLKHCKKAQTRSQRTKYVSV